MQSWVTSGLVLIITLLGITRTNANELALPATLPPLNATSAAELGTLDGAGLAAGAPVPGFTIHSHLGEPVSWADLKKNGALLVVFYRGGWCPYCNRQIRQLTETWPQFEQRKVTPVLISADKPDAAALASRTYEIPFPVLSDPELVAHGLFKVTTELDPELIPKYREYGIDLTEWNGKGHHKYAVASAFLINKQGVVVWSHSANDYKTRPSALQLLQVIDDYKGSLYQ